MHPKKPENPFFNIAFNILLPVVILNKGHLLFPNKAEIGALGLALSFPFIYGLFDLFKNKRKNFISLLGALNVCFTGGFALLHLSGIWFAVKEALFPLLIGLFVLFSSYTKKNFFEYLIRSMPLNWALIEEKTQALSSASALKTLFQKATIYFSFSFFVSAILNFVLALYIFADKSTEQPNSLELNQKIADMTYLGFLVIGLPLTLFSVFVFWRFLRGLSYLTGLSVEQILPKK